ncbi:RsmB/NOP family class I SAM-dependent RNA methyltransferase [Brevifollis gellanilyticus]|uniref:Ribosomal RNA small subunit methyltransferase B n=1 Tax=Brevifollis gellanilyticus TaxID=748831 RepID=A0A512MF77_9BACT|nr:transcription antitermination factor NusB [Brevifollis gellanilyticus]GEP45397.1 ribosomal RNA small subunit methyltransferase B [Brevifollis gellanilyticus]
MNVRRLSVEVLESWQKTPRYAADLLDDKTRQATLSGPNAAFLHDIVLTTLRNLTMLDHWVDHLTNGRHLDHRTRWVLRIGLCQLMLLGVPSHAAVNETVATAGRASGLVNAVLRRAGREMNTLLAQRKDLPLAVAYSQPEYLIRRWIKIMGKAKTEALCQWNQEPAETHIRLNRLHDEAEARLSKITGLTAHATEEDFFLVNPVPREALKSGICYAQDPSTSIAPKMLGARPGETVLDACAAPGGKTALIAQMMVGEGKLIACDSSPARLNRLRENLTRLRVHHAQVMQHDFLSSDAPPFGDLLFDRILLDVPCSNTGVMRRRIDVRWRLNEPEFAELAQTQRGIAESALRYLKPGGSLVYSTCSIDPEENQQLVKALMAAHPELEMAESRLVFPPKDQMDGAYAARLVKKA